MIEIKVGDKAFTISDAEEKALLTDIVDLAEWIENLLTDKARRVMDRVIEEHTEFNSRKLSPDQKRQIVRTLRLKTAKERKIESDNEMR
ncbi:hypothetical protein DRJ16_06470 [Candidatus Woesearchaeota archaeon]|nr:MAG: hypothetical protein DRJ16_06470 [Candidatus Woesearchaeota archaeon]